MTGFEYRCAFCSNAHHAACAGSPCTCSHSSHTNYNPASAVGVPFPVTPGRHGNGIPTGAAGPAPQGEVLAAAPAASPTNSESPGRSSAPGPSENAGRRANAGRSDHAMTVVQHDTIPGLDIRAAALAAFRADRDREAQLAARYEAERRSRIAGEAVEYVNGVLPEGWAIDLGDTTPTGITVIVGGSSGVELEFRPATDDDPRPKLMYGPYAEITGLASLGKALAGESHLRAAVEAS